MLQRPAIDVVRGTFAQQIKVKSHSRNKEVIVALPFDEINVSLGEEFVPAELPRVGRANDIIRKVVCGPVLRERDGLGWAKDVMMFVIGRGSGLNDERCGKWMSSGITAITYDHFSSGPSHDSLDVSLSCRFESGKGQAASTHAPTRQSHSQFWNDDESSLGLVPNDVDIPRRGDASLGKPMQQQLLACVFEQENTPMKYHDIDFLVRRKVRWSYDRKGARD